MDLAAMYLVFFVTQQRKLPLKKFCMERLKMSEDMLASSTGAVSCMKNYMTDLGAAAEALVHGGGGIRSKAQQLGEVGQ